ncbi:MAG: S49 family peptidase [Planctomycetota bacterium]
MSEPNASDSPPPSGAPSPRPPMDPRVVSAPPPPPGYLPFAPPPAKPKGVLSKVGTSLLVSLIVLSLLLNFYLGAILVRLTAGSEAVYQEGATDERIVVVPVVGAIDDEMSRFVRGALRDLENNPPAALILRVESGGGGVTASDQIWNQLNAFRQAHPDVPIVASFGGVAASGGYYIAAGTDHIFCEPTGFTGSIGVIAQVPTLAGTMRMLGVDWVTQVAEGSPLKDEANNMFRSWDDDDRAVLGYLIDSAYDRFVEVVTDGRDQLDGNNIADVANGSIFTANDAKENGLIDGIGYLAQAIDEAANRAGLPSDQAPRVTVVKQPGEGLLALLTGQRQADPSSETPHRLMPNGVTPQGLRSFLQDFTEVELAYRWIGS